MMRGPVQASLPSLDPFPREAGTSGHVYPCSVRSTSPGTSQGELRLPSSIASSTFWRSPYSEAIRQARAPRRSEPQPRDVPRSALVAPPQEEERGNGQGDLVVKQEEEAVVVVAKAGTSEGRDSGSDTSSDHVRQIRGILCKSSLSSNSRQSVGKVQKRVKFDDSVDKGSSQSPRQVSSASSSPTCSQSPPLSSRHRSASASGMPRSPMRVPSLRHRGGERLQSIDMTTLSQGAPAPHSQPPNPHQHPHIPRPQSGPLIRTSSVPELTLPRAAPRSSNQQSLQLLHSPHSVQNSHSLQSGHSPHSFHGLQSGHSLQSGHGSHNSHSLQSLQNAHSLHSSHSLHRSASSGPSSSRLSPTALEFKIYRQPPAPASRTTGDTSPAPQHRARYFATPGNSSRALVRLSRSLTSPAITVHHRPLKQPAQPVGEDPPHPAWAGAFQEATPRSRAVHESQITIDDVDGDGDKEGEEKRGSFLDDDKTVQILHWLQEVDHRQAREGRCPVFVHGSCREG